MDNYVYLMRAGRGYKIGRSNKPVRRQSELIAEAKQYYKERPEIVHTIPTTRPRQLEREMHAIFKPWRHHGEWYLLPPDAVMWFCRQTENLEEVPSFQQMERYARDAPEDELLRPEEVAAWLGVTRATVSQWIKTEQIACVWISERTVRIRVKEVLRIQGLTQA